uniref:Uncharacterized protein n=1 Tax=Janibacter limosus TaxID=53458 RepID=A0AC61U7C1_9MICO|nr:hypothetical protein [Janibacter limosus]
MAYGDRYAPRPVPRPRPLVARADRPRRRWRPRLRGHRDAREHRRGDPDRAPRAPRRPPRAGHPRPVRPLGSTATLAAPRSEGRPPVIAVFGSSMNSGKSTVLGSIVNGLVGAGLQVAAGKSTGTGAGNDPHHFRDAGASTVLDFTDFGHATTYRLGDQRIREIFVDMVDELAATGPDVVVIEVADGVYREETRRLLEDPAFHERVDRVVFASQDALGAVAGMQVLDAAGVTTAAVSGVVTSSPGHQRGRPSPLRPRHRHLRPARAAHRAQPAAERSPRIVTDDTEQLEAETTPPMPPLLRGHRRGVMALLVATAPAHSACAVGVGLLVGVLLADVGQPTSAVLTDPAVPVLALPGLGATRYVDRVAAERLGQDYVQELRRGLVGHAMTSASAPSLGITIARSSNDPASVRNWVSLGIAPIIAPGPARRRVPRRAAGRRVAARARRRPAAGRAGHRLRAHLGPGLRAGPRAAPSPRLAGRPGRRHRDRRAGHRRRRWCRA